MAPIQNLNELVVQLIDFGGIVEEKNITHIIVTLEMRAPEQILNSKYLYPIDIWGMG